MIYKFLPKKLFNSLYGDRDKYGTQLNLEDPEFQHYEKHKLFFYNNSQKTKLGNVVNHFGFKIVKGIDWDNKTVLEVGPGTIQHFKYNKYSPSKYYLVDCDKEFLQESRKICEDNLIPDIEEISVSRDSTEIPVGNDSIDFVISFHQLEHIYNLDEYLVEIKRILKPGGFLVGAVPTEGSLFWGLGRFFTTRRFLIKQLKCNFSKVISWEHPNFVDKIQQSLPTHFLKVKEIKKPFNLLPNDFNLSYSFVFQKN